MLFFRTARNCSDSGRPVAIATAMTSGTAPPKMNTDRQPNAGISHAATNPPMAAPTVKPTVMHIISVTRLASG